MAVVHHLQQLDGWIPLRTTSNLTSASDGWATHAVAQLGMCNTAAIVDISNSSLPLAVLLTIFLRFWLGI